MTDELSFRSLAELSRLLATGAVSSRDVVHACLERIAALDAKLHAFVDVYRDDALASADAADRERRAKWPRGPLHGLPIALKDLLHLAGRQTTAGSKSWRGRISDHTATCVERLIAAGMIPLGKTHLVEFAFGGWGRNEPMGAPWNPWDTSVHRVAGGSSSGSAVATAAGLTPAALGTDTGGSVRIPSGLCGLTGLKTTYGLISLYGAVPLSGTLDTIGPIAHTAEDAALLTAAMAGPDARDSATRDAPAFDLGAALADAGGVRGMRISVLPVDQFPSIVCADALAAHAAMIAALSDLGARVEEVRVPLDFDDVTARNGRIIAAEGYAVHRAYIEDPALPIDPWVRKRMVSGKAIGAADYIDELAARRRAQAAFTAWMRDRDALLTPTLPIAAIPLDDVDENKTTLATFTRAANYLGACALSLPAGVGSEKLPLGVQLIGAPFADAKLLRIGRAVQQTTTWHRERPDLSAWA
jgi:aspartyl-tRNA(Asn)/glutamyl-tRNA(Gln) amidotransferase subunit A